MFLAGYAGCEYKRGGRRRSSGHPGPTAELSADGPLNASHGCPRSIARRWRRGGSAMRLPLQCSWIRQSIGTSRRKGRGPKEGRRPRLRKTLPMNIETLRALRGANLWSDETVLEAILVLEKADLEASVFGRLCGLLPQGMAAELFQEFAASDSAAFWARVVARLTLG